MSWDNCSHIIITAVFIINPSLSLSLHYQARWKICMYIWTNVTLWIVSHPQKLWGLIIQSVFSLGIIKFVAIFFTILLNISLLFNPIICIWSLNFTFSFLLFFFLQASLWFIHFNHRHERMRDVVIFCYLLLSVVF